MTFSSGDSDSAELNALFRVVMPGSVFFSTVIAESDVVALNRMTFPSDHASEP